MNRIIPGMVSICIPSRNRRNLVLRAVESSLKQTYANVQVIVSDNASGDGTADAVSVIDDPRLHLLRQRDNIGLVGNLNSVLHAAEGEFFILLSDDDVLEPDAIERLHTPFLKGAGGKPASEIGLAWCPCAVINAAGEPMYSTAAGPQWESSVDFMHGLYTGTRGPRLSSVLVRTADAWAAGSYDEPRLGALCDTENWGTVALRYPGVACIRSPLVKYTVHAASQTSEAQCADWQNWGRTMLADHVATVRQRGDERGARKLECLRKPLLANLTVDVLMRGMGTRGWIGRTLPEIWRSRGCLFTPYCFRRLLRDGAKLFR